MSILDADFMRLAFAAGAIVGLLAPAVGFFLVQRGMSLIGDGIGHAAFAGVALGYLLGVSPVATALATSVAGAVTVEWLRARRRAAGDQALALLFYTGIAAGVVLVSAAVAILGTLGLALIAALYRALVATALDEEAARVSGVPVGMLNVVLAALAGVTIAVSMRIVGILLIAALMVLPASAAGRIAWSVRSTILLAMGIGVASVFAGLIVSYYADLAPGGTIVLAAAASFAVTSAAAAARR